MIRINPYEDKGRSEGDDAPALCDLDFMTNAMLARLTMGVSPTAVMKDYFTWFARLAASPGKQLQLLEKATTNALTFYNYAVYHALDEGGAPCIDPLPQDHRFEDEGWRRFPYNLIHQGFLLAEQWWHIAVTGVRGVPKTSENAVDFITRQWLDIFSPSNAPFLNPEVTEETLEKGGVNFIQGLRNLTEDVERFICNEKPAGAEDFRPGKEVATAPGKVVFRNHLIELIQYTPTTEETYREPLLMMPAWMMKYYIMDLSPDNSMVKYLVDQGHTVFMISWRNPDAEDWDLGMEDYRRQGFMAGLDAVSDITGEKAHAVGYCLGGALLLISAAAMAREGDDRLASVTLFTTLPDFTDAGEMSVFMDPRQVAFLEDMMWEKGYLDTRRIAGGFQLIRSRDLIWSKMVREYYLGKRTPMFDLMAWNADGTRMPYRQHSEVLERLYRDNHLFEGKYDVEGRPVALSNIRVPMFSVAAEKDHIAPWRSAYKLHLQSRATEFAFLLTKGGHNAGIVSEPGHPGRSYQLSITKEGEEYIYNDPDAWAEQTPRVEGSWWPAWSDWLAEHSPEKRPAPAEHGAPDKGHAPLEDAPGTYVHQE